MRPVGSATPVLSVVIATHDAASIIQRCLAALDAQTLRASMEIIVADSSHDGTDAIVRRDFPHTILIHTDDDLGVPQLRGRAIARAAGRIIAVLDPFSVAESDWAASLIAAHDARSNLVIGGSVDLFGADTASLGAWAQYFNEYGMFMPPVIEGVAPILAGSNLSYKRSALFDGERPREPVFWKTFVNQAVEAGGSGLWLAPSIRVSLHKPIPYGEFLKTRVSHGRCFAATRSRRASWAVRLVRGLTAPVLPFVLWARWTRTFWPKARRRGLYLMTTPAQLVLFAAWAAGEAIGYLFGPGRSCDCLYY